MKTTVRCPFCVHDFVVELPTTQEKPTLKPSPEYYTALQSENETLKFENQRLLIETHRHRGE